MEAEQKAIDTKSPPHSPPALSIERTAVVDSPEAEFD
jgi:hypothetical protein